MDIDQRYLDIIASLNRHERYHKALTSIEIEYLNEKMPTSDESTLEKIFCILANTQTSSKKFEENLLTFLNTSQNKNLKIFALEATRKHVIDYYFKNGYRLPIAFFETIKKLLSQNEPQVLEWVLRIIDECGSQGLIFREHVKKVRPSIFKLYNKHYRVVLELCEFLERKWNGARPTEAKRTT